MLHYSKITSHTSNSLTVKEHKKSSNLYSHLRFVSMLLLSLSNGIWYPSLFANDMHLLSPLNGSNACNSDIPNFGPQSFPHLIAFE